MVAIALRPRAEAMAQAHTAEPASVKVLEQVPNVAASNGSSGARPPTVETDVGALSAYAARMLVTRSLSADGTLDVVSVRLELELDALTLPEMKTLGGNALKLETDIIETYFATSAAAAPSPPATHDPPVQHESFGEDATCAAPARLLDIGKTESNAYFINVKVGAQTARLFGSTRKLVSQLARAGLDLTPEAISEKLALNFDCRAITKPSTNGRYLQVVKLFPAA